MDFLFHVPFFCTAAAGVAEILTVSLFVNIEFCKSKKLILSFRPNIIIRVPKQSESTRRKQAIFNKGSLFYSHCGLGKGGP
jgi:hypothetical protein